MCLDGNMRFFLIRSECKVQRQTHPSRKRGTSNSTNSKQAPKTNSKLSSAVITDLAPNARNTADGTARMQAAARKHRNQNLLLIITDPTTIGRETTTTDNASRGVCTNGKYQVWGSMPIRHRLGLGDKSTIGRQTHISALGKLCLFLLRLQMR